MEIREIRPQDRAGLSEILKRFLDHAGNQELTPAETQRVFDWALDPKSNFVLLGAFARDQFVGMVSITFAKSTFRAAPFGWLDDLYVDEAYRGQGVAKSLLAGAKKIAERHRCSNILLGVGHDETSVIELYETMGYTDMRCHLMTLPLSTESDDPKDHDSAAR